VRGDAVTPLFLGIAGAELSADERALFRAADPAGYILFARNCSDPDQVRALTDSLRDLAGRDLPILIDQEGGRVARLRPPHWPAFPAAATFAARYQSAPITAIAAARANAAAIALVLQRLGITVDCLPLLDVLAEGGHDIIGDRGYGDNPQHVAALGKATLNGLRDGGVVGVIKHIPGHGRACVDSHLDLPVVAASRAELETDFAPFRALAATPMAMTAHIVYTALDPDRCATLSPVVIGDIIRGDIGFDGLLMSDDLGMHALGGSFAARATAALAAGCDIALHCSGDFVQMVEIVDAVGDIAPRAAERLAAATVWAKPATGDIDTLIAMRDALLAA
jgi:beta-N-acetylhexosaminidase